MGRQGFLGEFEQMVLLAILQLEGQAYGPNISEELEARAIELQKAREAAKRRSPEKDW